MYAPSKTLLFMLLAAVIAAPLAAQRLPPGSPSQERPAGCHQDGGNVPSPEPANHSCCQVAHHPAILQQSSSSRPSLQSSALVDYFCHAVMPSALGKLPLLAIASGDPPLTSPLRV